MLDAHCHLDAPGLSISPAGLSGGDAAEGVVGRIWAGVDPEGWVQQSALARAQPGVRVTYGLHPWTAGAASEAELDFWLVRLEAALDDSELASPVGVGECGLDRSSRLPSSSLPIQRRALSAQLALARSRDLPVVLHVVRCHGLAHETLAVEGLPSAGGMVHGFSGSAEVVSAYLKLGLHLSFGPTLLREGSARRRAALLAVPSDRLLVETDDSPTAGTLSAVVEAVARLRDETPEAVARYTADNARRLFRWPEESP